MNVIIGIVSRMVETDIDIKLNYWFGVLVGLLVCVPVIFVIEAALTSLKKRVLAKAKAKKK